MATLPGPPAFGPSTGEVERSNSYRNGSRALEQPAIELHDCWFAKYWAAAERRRRRRRVRRKLDVREGCGFRVDTIISWEVRHGPTIIRLQIGVQENLSRILQIESNGGHRGLRRCQVEDQAKIGRATAAGVRCAVLRLGAESKGGVVRRIRRESGGDRVVRPVRGGASQGDGQVHRRLALNRQGKRQEGRANDRKNPPGPWHRQDAWATGEANCQQAVCVHGKPCGKRGVRHFDKGRKRTIDYTLACLGGARIAPVCSRRVACFRAFDGPQACCESRGRAKTTCLRRIEPA